MLAAIRTTAAVKGMAHITGGGFTENIPRVLPDGVAARINLDALTLRPVFGWLRETGSIAEGEMLKTFNCGVGMVVIVEASARDAVVEALESEGEAVIEMGSLVKRDGDAVVYQGTL